MFAEFGQAPLCLELDLDSYDGPWQHVARFRRGSGWLMVAECTIQSEHDILTARLVAACDEREHPVPAFQAHHLTQCDWINPTYCDELPPDILDDLICEEEGALIARWHREKNSALAEAFENHEARIAELEGRVQPITARNEAQIAELRQRRRHPDATPEMRLAMRQIIDELDSENDELIAEMAETRATLREQAAEFEETLWAREDLLIEVSPVHVIRWTARTRAYADVPARPKPYSSLWVPACGPTGGATPGFAEQSQANAASVNVDWKPAKAPKEKPLVSSSLKPAKRSIRAVDLEATAMQLRNKLLKKNQCLEEITATQAQLKRVERRIARLNRMRVA